MKQLIRKIVDAIIQIILKTVENRHLNRHPKRHLGGRLSVMQKKRIARGVKRFFDQYYELRFNILKQSEEFRPRTTCQAAGFEREAAGFERQAPPAEQGWQPLTERELQRINFEQMERVGVAWSIDVEHYVRSTLTPDYNPVTDYLDHCGPWNRTSDHIRALARRVPTSYATWPDLFHRWFLGMVAQWLHLNPDYGNAIVPMLIGGQGTHKSTFCRLLLPPELREYYIDDVKLDNAEQVERMLCRMLLVNIDEFNSKTDREQAKIKRILTERDVQTRRMRSDRYEQLPRMASFIATTNDRQPLFDPSGSRRYLCCELDGTIDTGTPIDYRQLYAQAVDQLRSGTAYYFSKAEEQAVERHNETYRIEISAETLLLTYFEPAPRHRDHFMLATEIQQELARYVRAADLPSLKKLTLALRRCSFALGAINGRRGWYATRLSP